MVLRRTVALFSLALAHSGIILAADPDVVIYGGTAAAITAAVQVVQMGRTVVIVSPDEHSGGLSSSGLGFTDTGNKAVIGGLAREFYHRIYQHYQKPESWVQQKKEEYGNKGQGTPAIDGDQRTMWIFEPHAADKVFEDWMRERGITMVRNAWLDREKGVKKDGAKITAITTLDGRTWRGAMFIDATYEGDLMAAAGVDYHTGREANSVYDEEHNGVQTGVLHHRHHFGVLREPMSPWKVPGDPQSGALPGISTEPPGEKGSGDHRIQAYCFRSCYTNDPANRIPFPRPEGYDAGEYELLLRVLQTGWDEFFDKFDPIPNHKTDTNNHGPFSFDYIGGNYDYPEASYARRREIIARHRTYQQGLLWFVANDPRVPRKLQEKLRTWGLPKDEFTANGNWPHQLYIREARRMKGLFVMTENQLRKKRPTPDSVGMGSYSIDSHNVQRYITPDGHVQNEGDIEVSTHGPYAIASGALMPRESQATNLLVPVAVSASHIAYGSIRMEPVFMILGQSAATTAVLALQSGVPVQQVPYSALRQRLLQDGQILEYQGPAVASADSIAPASLPGITVDDAAASKTGDWTPSSANRPNIGVGYCHDGNTARGTKNITFRATLPAPGLREVILAWPPHENRATNVPVTIRHAKGETTLTVNQRQPGPISGHMLSLGTYEFGTTGEVTLTNTGTDGYVVADAVRWLPK